MTNRPFRWSLVGASDIARAFVGPAISAQPDAAVVSVVSGDLARAQDVAAPFGARGHDELTVALSDPDVDAVYISSINSAHHDQALAAIAVSKHVLCEKPLALTVAEAQELVDAAEKAGVVFATNHHMRNSVPHRLIRDAIAAGDIGEPVAVNVRNAIRLPPAARRWRTTDSAAGAGVALDLTVHDADCLRFVLNADPLTVVAHTSSGHMTRVGIDETISGSAEFVSGVHASFVESFVTGHAPTCLEVFGTEGALIGTGIQSMSPVGTLTHVGPAGSRKIDLGTREDLYVVGVRRFIEAVRGEAEPPASGQDGVWSLAFARAALEAARTGHRQTVGQAR
ncbi:Gfo/Idh/MocA family protein [Saccharopolyspora spinosa]|uniref:Gfo/Idh/MocA family protein n=1 Tax=Saccharopolyspora spinosa TaxID=60894 RepID=UPI0037489B11